MNILFDINHPVDINFFKESINRLKSEGHKVVISYRPRGKLERIINFELGEFNPIKIGKHYLSFFSKIKGQLYRDFLMYKFQKKEQIDISVCFGPTNAISSWINKIPYICFDDDFEYKIPFYHANLFSTKHVIPDFILFNNKKIVKYKGFKELAYLHPEYLDTSQQILDNYKIKNKKYVFIREIESNVSLNYKNAAINVIDIVKYIKDKNYDIVLSLEDNKLKDSLSSDCIVLEEPVEDIFAIIQHASFAISSGDTMAREASLLCTPCIYTGGRDMYVNKELIQIGAMYREVSFDDVCHRIDLLLDEDFNSAIKNKINYKILNEWDDTTKIILNNIREFIH